MRVKPKQSPATEDKEIATKILKEQPNLSEIYPINTYEELKKALNKWLNPEERYGFQTTMVTKPLIIAQLAYDIANKVVPWFPEEYIGELYSYMRISDRKTEASEGEFDDRVMEVAIGRYCGKEYQRYVIAFSSCCDFCSEYHYVDKGCGWCKRSKRWCQIDDVCRMFTSNGVSEVESILSKRKREEASQL